MPRTLRELETLTTFARKEGARGSELLLTSHQRRDVTLRRNGSPLVRRSEGELLAVRVWLEGGKEGRAEGAPEEAEQLILQALAAAGKAEEQPGAGPADLLSAPVKGLDIDDRRYAQISDDDILEVLTDNERSVGKAAKKVEIKRLAWRDERTRRMFLNSKGVGHDAWGTRYDAWSDIAARSGELRLEEQISGRAFASMACLPYATHLAQRVEHYLAPDLAVDGPIRVLLPSRPMARLCAWIAEQLLPERLAQGRSFLARAAGDPEPLFHRKIHLVDDGQLPGGLRTWPFDDRGVPPVPLTLLREGRIDARYLDLQGSRAKEIRATGHEHGGSLRPSNLILSGGVRTINVFLSENPEPVFLVDDLEDLSGLDARTGELDVPVRGELIEGGERKVVPRARLKGSLIRALQQVQGVASDTDRHGHIDAPAFFVDGLAVSVS